MVSLEFHTSQICKVRLSLLFKYSTSARFYKLQTGKYLHNIQLKKRFRSLGSFSKLLFKNKRYLHLNTVLGYFPLVIQ